MTRRLFRSSLLALALLLPGTFEICVAQAPQPSPLDRAYAEMVSAQAGYEAALDARDKGVEPLPGERLGTVSGRSRLGPDYFSRQERLGNDVKAAQAVRDEAIRRWNALR